MESLIDREISPDSHLSPDLQTFYLDQDENARKLVQALGQIGIGYLVEEKHYLDVCFVQELPMVEYR
ncbi:hypothetical protein NF212_19265 [Parasalinivibrio latis]|uniref:hypothetical protein n=1 Tax=Parasalinivibrio latis TaxID=2952610 RepID=UPI0030E1DE9D